MDFLKRDVDKLERVQRQGTRWAKGAHGVVSVSGILRELGWKELASLRKEQRLTMLHKILHGELAILHDAVNIKHMQRSRSHSMALVRPCASYTASPLWTCTIFTSIKDWNQLPSMVAEAGTMSTFKARLTGLSQWRPPASIGVLPRKGPRQLQHKTNVLNRMLINCCANAIYSVYKKLC